MPIVNEVTWREYEEVNDDPYGKCCVDVAREVMRILDNGEDFDPHELIIKAEHNIGEEGITGFMAGAIAQMVYACHSRGKEFREKWNRGYTEEDLPGVVNPAIMTVSA